MVNKQVLYDLLESYTHGKLNTDTFCDAFTTLYALETDYELLSEKEHELFKRLCDFTKRFSPFEEDLIKYPNVYYTDKEIREKAEEIAQLLDVIKG